MKIENTFNVTQLQTWIMNHDNLKGADTDCN